MQNGTVKFFDGKKHLFGFVIPDAGGPDVFINKSTLDKAGLPDLTPGQRVRVRVVPDRRGNRPRATWIELIDADLPMAA